MPQGDSYLFFSGSMKTSLRNTDTSQLLKIKVRFGPRTHKKKFKKVNPDPRKNTR